MGIEVKCSCTKYKKFPAVRLAPCPLPAVPGCAGDEKFNCKNEIFLTVFPDRFAARTIRQLTEQEVDILFWYGIKKLTMRIARIIIYSNKQKGEMP